MPEVTHTSQLQAIDDDIVFTEDDRPTMIKVDHVSMEFNMASEKMNSLKEYAIALAKRKLFFESFKALDDVSFEVKKGDVFGILGTNGSGKSTMLKIIAGVLTPTQGTCEVNGNIAPLIELGAGFDMELSARENIYLNGALLGYSREFIQDHFDDIVSFAEIDQFLDMPMKNYSSGMIARIAFAIATVIVPEILIVDEVLSVGDFMFQQKCEDRINDLITNHGVTVLIVSHSNDQIERLCNKAIWIEKGHTRIMGDATQVCNAYRVLGGRTGSAESEKIVFDALKEVEFGKCQFLSSFTIGGEDHFELSANLAWEGWQNKSHDAVFLVSDVSQTHALSATGLAGALGAPIIPFRDNESIPSSVENTLLKLQPDQIFIVAESDSAISASKDSKLKKICPDIIPIACDPLCVGIRPCVIDFGNKIHRWGSQHAFVCSFQDHLLSVAFSYFAYKDMCPFLVFDEEEQTLDLPTATSLQNAGINKLIVLGSMNKDDFIKSAAELGFEIECMLNKDGDYLFETSKLIDRMNSQSAETICIGSGNKSNWQDIIGIPAFSASNNMNLLLANPYDLDDFSHDITFMSSQTVNTIVFAGQKTFNGITKKILSKI